MRAVVHRVLRVVLAAALAGSVVVQAVILPLVWADLDGAPTHLRTSLVTIAALWIVALQVVGVCVWRLLTMVGRGTVFSSSAFRFVDVIIGAVAAASLLTFVLGMVLAPGEEVAPGVVLLVGGAGVVVAGVALLVYVLRTLLAQAVALDTRAQRLQAELDEVI
jgi:hypothetical protein